MPETMPSVGVPAILLMVLVLFAILIAWVGVVLRLAFGMTVLPPRTPRYVPWGAGSVIVAVVSWLVLQIAVPSVYYRLAYPRVPAGGPRHELSPAEQMALSAVINAFILVLIPLMLRVTCGARLRDFGLVLLGLPRQIFRGMATYPLLAPLVFGAMIGSLLIWNKTNHPLEDAIRLHHSPGMLVVMVLAGVVFAPLAEELIFRGVLLGWLTRVVLGRPKLPSGDELFDQSEPVAYVDLPEPVESGFGDGLDRDPHNPYAPPGTKLLAPPLDVETTSATLTSSRTILLILANVIVSVIFAGLHSAVWPTPIPIFFLSLGLGVLYQRTGSLIPSMALHMTFNGVSTMLMLLTLGASLPKAKESAKPADAPAKVEAKPAAFVVDLNLFPKRSH